MGFAFVAALYFCFLCVDAYAIGTIENRIENLVSTLPPGHRVIALPPLTLTHDYTQEHVTGRIDNHDAGMDWPAAVLVAAEVLFARRLAYWAGPHGGSSLCWPLL